MTDRKKRYQGEKLGTTDYDIPAGTPGVGDGSGGGGGMGLPSAGIGGAISGGLSAFGNTLFGGRQAARDMENQFNANIQTDRFLNPNRSLEGAMDRNFRGNLMQNLQGVDLSGAGGMGRLLDAAVNSYTNGINPQLQQEHANIAGVPGLKIGGEYVGEDPSKMFEAKKPGFGEALAAGGLGALGGFFGG